MSAKLKSYCTYCGAHSLTSIDKTFTDGQAKIELRCEPCGAFNGYQNQATVETATFPFGKYQHRSLLAVYAVDVSYFKWAATASVFKPNLREKMTEILKSKGAL